MVRNLVLIFALLCVLTPTTDSAVMWWEEETCMKPGGILVLHEKDWWETALQLETGSQLMRLSKLAGGGMMIVRKEKRTRGEGEMIVWILDDDGDMDADHPQGDGDSDCYIADYGCDGIVDRMVDYIDSDGDNVPDEMDIRYFVNGELRRSWFGNDLDGDGLMWDTADYEYTANFFRSDPYGANEIYMNKYNPHNNTWLPISECPFSFYDIDNDGESEAVVRFSAAPLTFSSETDPDYANSQRRYQGEYDAGMERMGVVNVRYSFDIDGLSSKENPLHYEMGFTMTGASPYEFPGMIREQPLRRSPKKTVCIPYDLARQVSDTYHAEQTGFTWREFEDYGLRIGHPARPEYDRRWEGVFWTWKRRILHNTGGPVQDWNVRREFLGSPSDRREIYYSPVDHRLHLKGASEGWLLVGRIGNLEPLAEVRMFDTTDDGYFDRWEYFSTDSPLPYRTANVSDVKNRDFGDDWKAMQAFYTYEALPESIRLNKKLIEEMKSICAAPVPDRIKQAFKDDISPDERRYLLDIVREIQYQGFRKEIRVLERELMDAIPDKEPRSTPGIMENSTKVWNLSVLISKFDTAYANGDFAEAIEQVQAIRTLINSF